jgi:hypothetical protein
MTPPLRKRSVSRPGVTSSAEDQQSSSVDIGVVFLTNSRFPRIPRLKKRAPRLHTPGCVRSGERRRGPCAYECLRRRTGVASGLDVETIEIPGPDVALDYSPKQLVRSVRASHG